MKLIRRRVYTLLAILSLTASVLGFPDAAQASSAYDDNYTTVDSLFYGDVSYYGINCPMQDVSANFLDIFSNPNYWVNTGEYDAYWPSLEDAVEDGSLAVSIQQDRMSTGYDANVDLSWNATGGEISFQYNQVVTRGSGTKMAQLYMRQDLLGSGGCVPAIRAFSGGVPIATNPGVDISTTTNGFYHSNYFASGWSVTYPTGYEGGLIREEKPVPKYVAMGDSFSSGEGNPPFEYGTDTGSNKCHRSSAAYPRLLQNDSTLSLGSAAFVACSGAKTSNVLNGGSADGAWGENPQIDALSADTEVATITIGGNNVGFSDYALACTETLCGPGTFDYDYIMGQINDSDFYDSLVTTYESILTHAPNAQIYVSGYPYLAAEDSDVCGQVDLTGAWAVQNQLNAVINDAVDDVRGSTPTTRLHYVDPNQTGSPFNGKYLCNGGTSDFNGLTSPTAYSFHPNTEGHQDFKSVFADAIS